MRAAGIYVHVPYCKSKCRYCSFVSTVNVATQRKYVERLMGEIERCPHEAQVKTLYIGGGTPSCLYEGAISEIVAAIGNKFAFQSDVEFTVEANPESATDAFFDECKRAGVNRISIGLQCADDEVLEKAGRKHRLTDFLSAVEKARKYGFDNISTDVMIGLEGESKIRVLQTLELLAKLEIPHISMYSLSVEKGCIMYSKEYRPDEDFMADCYEAASRFLSLKGYERYEISNFALKGKVSKHNMGYWLHLPYIGFGAAAHSYFGDERSANTESIAAYLDGTTTVSSEKIDIDQLREEYVMLRMRLKDGICLSEYAEKFGQDILQTRQKQVEKLLRAGVVEIDNDRLYATDKGVYVLNYVITELI